MSVVQSVDLELRDVAQTRLQLTNLKQTYANITNCYILRVDLD